MLSSGIMGYGRELVWRAFSGWVTYLKSGLYGGKSGLGGDLGVSIKSAVN